MISAAGASDRALDEGWLQQVKQAVPYEVTGRVQRIVGLSATVGGFPAPMGALCQIQTGMGKRINAEVVGFHEQETTLLADGDLHGVRRGDEVRMVKSVPLVQVGTGLVGRIMDGRGRFIDSRPPALLPHRMPLYGEPVSPLSRPPIDAPLQTGVRAIDGFLTCGMGQRLGLFAGSGVGKSTLLGQIARSSTADLNVVVLVGERGREVREFMERDLGEEGLARSVVVFATSEESALIRLRAAYYGTAIAEYFRDMGLNVLLMMDSVTRFALAQREIGLAAGEPPATRGYPPSVFSRLPGLLERSGRTEKGTITALYTVLVESDDTNEPIADTVRGILDGHVMLSRHLAHEGHWPAIDVLSSVSRVMNEVVSQEHRASATNLRQLLAAYKTSEDLINVGAYQSGSNPVVDTAIKAKPFLDQFLQQTPEESIDLQQTIQLVEQLAKGLSAVKTEEKQA